jgi:hypothetical protein
MVRVRAWLVPPLVQPIEDEFPPGVLTVTEAVPVVVITASERATCNCVLLRTVVVSVVPLI